MADFSTLGGVGIMGFISPMDSLDTYAVIDPIYGVDGLRNVDTESDLDFISYERRRPGMIVGVGGGEKYYKLKNDFWTFTISDWEQIYLYTVSQSAITSNEIVGGYLDYVSQTLVLTKASGGTITITGLTDTYITGGTFNVSGSTLELYTNYGQNISITGFSSTVSVSANTGLGIDSSILYTSYDTLLDPNLAMASQVGGLSVGTTVSTLSGKTFVSLFDDLLFPTQQPTYTIPTISINNSNITQEIGSTYNNTITVTATKNDAGEFTYLDLVRNSSTVLSWTTTPASASTTNIPSQFGYSDPNNPNYIFTLTYSESYVIPSGVTSSSTTYKGRGDYLSGLPKKTNKGGTDVRTPQVRSVNAPQSSASLFESSTKTITGIYPYYYGKMNVEPTVSSIIDAITGGTASKVLTAANSNLTINYNATTEFLWFAHLASYGLKSQWFVASDNKGLMSSSSLFDVGVTSPVSSELGYWNNVSFYIYLGNYATSLSSITLGNGLF